MNTTTTQQQQQNSEVGHDTVIKVVYSCDIFVCFESKKMVRKTFPLASVTFVVARLKLRHCFFGH